MKEGEKIPSPAEVKLGHGYAMSRTAYPIVELMRWFGAFDL
jgi:hypothetical protein